jgi:hypothetical protein
MGNVLQRADWLGQVRLGNAFTLHKQSADQSLEAVCRLVTDHFGSELRLEINGDLHRSEVCPTSDQVLDTSERWKAALLEKGWV